MISINDFLKYMESSDTPEQIAKRRTQVLEELKRDGLLPNKVSLKSNGEINNPPKIPDSKKK